METVSSSRWPLRREVVAHAGQGRVEGAVAAPAEVRATCHLRGGKVIVSSPKPLAAHPVAVDPRLSESVFCKDCHDFPVLERYNGELVVSTTSMQTTYQEWEAWMGKGGDASCQDCHM